MKRRANVARDSAASDASSATVHGRCGSACTARSAAPIAGSSSARNQAGAASTSAAKCWRSTWTSATSRRRSSRACCPGAGLQQLAARGCPWSPAGCDPTCGRRWITSGSAARSAGAQVALEPVGAAEERRRPGRRRDRRCGPGGSRRRGDPVAATSVNGRHAAPGWWAMWCSRLPRTSTRSPGRTRRARAASSLQRWVSPSTMPCTGDPGRRRERDAPVAPHRRVRERGAARPRALEQVGENVHEVRRWHMDRRDSSMECLVALR